MYKKRAIELLKQYLTEITMLRTLHHDNQEFELWKSKVTDVIKAGLEKEDYDKFITAKNNEAVIYTYTPGSGQSYPHERIYQADITAKETALKSLIQKYEILGVEEKPSHIKFQTPGQKYQIQGFRNEPTTDFAESPIQIFDAMQFHPKVIEASKSYFETGNYRGAILDAFIALIDYVKEKTKLKADTKDLMAKAFDPNKPVIKLNNLIEQYEIDEQEGFRFLYMGACVGIRNPKVHKLIPQSNPLHTLEYLAFASLLFRRIDEGNINKPEGA